VNPTRSLRRITAADIPVLFAIREATWHTPTPKQDMARLGITPEAVAAVLGQSHSGWLCETDGPGAGIAATGPLESRPIAGRAF